MEIVVEESARITKCCHISLLFMHFRLNFVANWRQKQREIFMSISFESFESAEYSKYFFYIESIKFGNKYFMQHNNAIENNDIFGIISNFDEQ